MKTYVLDACDLIAYSRKEDGGENVKQLLESFVSYPKKLCVHAATIAEVYYDSLRTKNVSEAEGKPAILKRLPVKIIEIIDDDFIRQQPISKPLIKIPSQTASCSHWLKRKMLKS